MGLIDTKESAKPLPSPKELEQIIQKKLPPEKQKDFERIVLAGMNVMFNPKMTQFALSQIKGADKAEDIGQNVGKLFLLLYEQSRRTMPITTGVQAGIGLCGEALELAAKAGLVPYDKDTYARVVKAYVAFIMQKLGVNANSLEQVKQRQQGMVQQGMAQQQPQQMQPQGV